MCAAVSCVGVGGNVGVEVDVCVWCWLQSCWGCPDYSMYVDGCGDGGVDVANGDVGGGVHCVEYGVAGCLFEVMVYVVLVVMVLLYVVVVLVCVLLLAVVVVSLALCGMRVVVVMVVALECMIISMQSRATMPISTTPRIRQTPTSNTPTVVPTNAPATLHTHHRKHQHHQ